ncbi:unnamed protein product [Musa textilis]
MCTDVAGNGTCIKAGRRVLRPTPPTLKSGSLPEAPDLSLCWFPAGKLIEEFRAYLHHLTPWP